LKSKPDSFIALVTAQINIFLYLYDDLSSLLNLISAETEKFMSKIDNKLAYFFNEPDSAFNKIVLSAEKVKSSPVIEKDLGKAIVTICRNIDQTNKQLNGKEHPDAFPKYDLLIKENTFKKDEVKKPSDGKFIKMFEGSTKQILDFTAFPDDRKESIINNLAEMSKIDKADPTAKDSRLIIRKMQQDFIDLYAEVFFQFIKDPENATNPVKLFLYFSFIDEKLLTEEQLWNILLKNKIQNFQ